MFSDGILDLVECNAITNSRKNVMPGKIVTSFVYGSKKLYDFLDNNPLIHFADVQWCNDPMTIRQNPKVTAINSAVEVDLTGQGKLKKIFNQLYVCLFFIVVADSVGKRFLSGFGMIFRTYIWYLTFFHFSGGQVDFIRGAAVSNDGLGKPIIALPSATKKGQSKIVPYIQEVSHSFCYYIFYIFFFRELAWSLPELTSTTL